MFLVDVCYGHQFSTLVKKHIKQGSQHPSSVQVAYRLQSACSVQGVLHSPAGSLLMSSPTTSGECLLWLPTRPSTDTSARNRITARNVWTKVIFMVIILVNLGTIRLNVQKKRKGVSFRKVLLPVVAGLESMRWNYVDCSDEVQLCLTLETIPDVALCKGHT